jgi:hypothetical protein
MRLVRVIDKGRMRLRVLRCTRCHAELMWTPGLDDDPPNKFLAAIFPRNPASPPSKLPAASASLWGVTSIIGAGGAANSAAFARSIASNPLRRRARHGTRRVGGAAAAALSRVREAGSPSCGGFCFFACFFANSA